MATEVQQTLRDLLARHQSQFDWETEFSVAATPVDVGGRHAETTVIVELEWRRADPADNTAKLFRHLHEGTLDAETVLVVQLFTERYDLQSGGVSSKRKNAEFVGRRAADSDPRVHYEAVDLAIDPPKRGGELPDDWEQSVASAAESVTELIDWQAGTRASDE
ncbi:MAG: hypothetical protein ABEH80_11345 [Halobaculum sp.]|jgi:hypothetical protein